MGLEIGSDARSNIGKPARKFLGTRTGQPKMQRAARSWKIAVMTAREVCKDMLRQVGSNQ